MLRNGNPPNFLKLILSRSRKAIIIFERCTTMYELEEKSQSRRRIKIKRICNSDIADSVPPTFDPDIRLFLEYTVLQFLQYSVFLYALQFILGVLFKPFILHCVLYSSFFYVPTLYNLFFFALCS
jgi:hypothetical protein